MNINVIEIIEYFSHPQRKNREFENFKKEYIKLYNMDADELEFEYITSKVDYEHNKNVSMLIVSMLLFSFLANVWGNFFNFFIKAIDFVPLLGSNYWGKAKVIWLLASIIILSIVFTILLFLHARLSELKKQKRHILILEHIRKKSA